MVFGFNYEYAFEFEKRKMYSEGFRLVKFALVMDSTSKTAAYPYSTLAELYGLTGNKAGFYSTIKKAISLGYNINDSSLTDQEPYKTFSQEREYKSLTQSKSQVFRH